MMFEPWFKVAMSRPAYIHPRNCSAKVFATDCKSNGQA